MSANNNHLPKNAVAESLIPLNPTTAHIQTQPQSRSPQQPSPSAFNWSYEVQRASAQSAKVAAAAAKFKAAIEAFNRSSSLIGSPNPPQANPAHITGNSVRAVHSEVPNLVQGLSSSKNEERTNESKLRSKRHRYETRSKKNKTFSSLPSNNEANASATSNDSITAKTESLGISPGVPSISLNLGKTGKKKSRQALDDSTIRCLDSLRGADGELPQKLRTIDPHLIEKICNEIMDGQPNVRWDDIAGLHHAKKCVTEMVIWPFLRPEIFKGCRSPGKGLLLFGPPGTGKTMIGKAIAGECKATFFYISASSVASKWVGEGEKLVRALFGVARCRQPAVIFFDEIDSLLSKRRSDHEHEFSRRLKTQFLIEMEGFDSGSEQVLLIGATNRPQDLDEAARRRLTKRLYVPFPSSEARAGIVRIVLSKDGLFNLSKEDIDTICELTEGYSGSDMKNLVKDASMGPIREALKQGTQITELKNEDMRSVTLQGGQEALPTRTPRSDRECEIRYTHCTSVGANDHFILKKLGHGLGAKEIVAHNE